MTLLFACIFVPDFSVEAVVRAEPEISLRSGALRQKPLAVIDGEPPLQTVVGVNERARELGVNLGMTKLQAEACPGIVLRKRSLAQEEAAHAALLDCAQAFSPRAESSAPDTVIVDVAGLEPLFGAPQKIARELARHVADVGLEANVAIASNPDCAVQAARGFPGVTVIPAGKEAERLGELPVDVLQPSAEILETLDRWGVRNLRTLAALPPLAVSERLGQIGLRLQRLARGEEQRTLVPAQEQFHFEESIELEDAVELLEPLSFLLNRLIEQICARLNARALATNELRLTLELEPADLEFQVSSCDFQQKQKLPTFERVLKLPVPMQNAKTFLKLLQLDLQQHPPGAPIKRVTLQAEPVRPKVAQGGLFSAAVPEAERLELTLARLRGVVGDATGSRVGTPQLVDTHRPDAFRMTSFSTQHASAVGHPPCASALVLMARRIFRPAIEARVQLRDGVPSAVFFRNMNSKVMAAAGPWRSCGDWWTSQSWSREEWELALKCGDEVGVYRVFRDAKSNRWFVDANYD